jgi:predicted enzyme related to lactoylglutathione lyase
LDVHHGQWPTFELGHGAYLVIAEGRPASAQDFPVPDFPVIAFAVENLEEAAEHLRCHGVELPRGIETGPGTRWFVFHDPAGNLVEFAQIDKSTQH